MINIDDHYRSIAVFFQVYLCYFLILKTKRRINPLLPPTTLPPPIPRTLLPPTPHLTPPPLLIPPMYSIKTTINNMLTLLFSLGLNRYQR